MMAMSQELASRTVIAAGTVPPSAAARRASVGKPVGLVFGGAAETRPLLMSVISWPWSKAGVVAASRLASGPRGRSRRRAAASVAASVRVLSSICLWIVTGEPRTLLVTGRTTARSVAGDSFVIIVACRTLADAIV